jgi:AP-3 complex subunit beta
MAKMIDKLTVPMARASILWLIGEYSDRVSKIAPDVLRKMAKSFCDEENVVKLQILNLSVKLYITNQKQVALLVQYILNLAKYDQNYDIRDRARFLRTLIFNNDKCPVFAKHLKKIMLVMKPAPVLQSAYKDSDQFQLGTLSHTISSRVNGYTDLPEFPLEAPDPTVRNIEVPVEQVKERQNERLPLSSKTHKSGKKSEKFYSDEEDNEEEKSQSTEGADPSNDEEENEEEESGSEEEEENGSESDETDKAKSGSDEESEEEDDSKVKKSKKTKDSAESSSSSEESDSSSESESESESEEEAPKKPVAKKVEEKKAPPAAAASKTQKKQSSESSSSESESESSSESDSEPEEPKPKAQVQSKKAAQPVEERKKAEPQAPKAADSKKTKQTPAPKVKEVSLLDLDCN